MTEGEDMSTRARNPKQLVVRLEEDDDRALGQEMERNGVATKAGMVRGLIRGMHTEIHSLGTVRSDLRLPSVLVELIDRMEHHYRKCGESCPHAMREYRFIMDRYRVTYTAKTSPQDLTGSVRISYPPPAKGVGK